MLYQAVLAVAFLAIPMNALPASGSLTDASFMIVKKAISSENVTLEDTVSHCTKNGSYAFTFDDGPFNYTREIVNTFGKAKLTHPKALATFFVNGNNYGCIYDQEYVDNIRNAYEQGHLIGSHGWGHVDMTTLNKAQITAQLKYVEDALVEIIGVKPKYFRPPYGAMNAKTRKVIEDLGYTIVQWSYVSGDDVSADPPVDEILANYEKLINGSFQSQITLNHETKKGTAEVVMPKVVPAAIKRGYSIDTVSTCLGKAGKDYRGKPSPFSFPDKSWICADKPGPGKSGDAQGKGTFIDTKA